MIQNAVDVVEELEWSNRTIAAHLSLPRRTLDGWVGENGVPILGKNGIPLALNTVLVMDAQEGMNRLPHESVDLIFADPPYNSGVNYGEMYSQALGETGKEYETLAHAVWVAGQFETWRRRQNLSWSHHAEVASLEPAEQDYWLDRAETEGWTRAQLTPLLPPGPTE